MFFSSGCGESGEELKYDNKKQTDYNTNVKIEYLDRGIKVLDYFGSSGEVIIPKEINNSRVLELGEWSFAYKGIWSLEMEGVVIIHNWAFYENDLSTLKLSNSVKYIGGLSFAYNRLREVVLSENLIEIGEMAFKGNKIEEVEIPKSVTVIGRGAFSENGDIIIYGRLGSEAERYASDENIRFVEMR